MEALLTQALLVAQAIIMLSLGIGLEVKDFKRVIERRYVFSIAMLCQVLVLPIFAFITIQIFSLPPVFAAGLMLLSFCPAGVTSNIISKLSRGDVALSVSLTAVVSVLSFLTVPPLTAWAILYFMGENAVTFSFFDLAFITFLITSTPVLIGVLIRHFKARIADIMEPILEKIAVVLWVIIVTLVVLKSLDKLTGSFAQLGGALLFLPLAMIILGLAISRWFVLSQKESKTLAIETSIQNGPLAIAIAATISGGGMVITELAMPAAVYSLTMYIVVLPFIFYFRATDKATAARLTAAKLR